MTAPGQTQKFAAFVKGDRFGPVNGDRYPRYELMLDGAGQSRPAAQSIIPAAASTASS